MVKSKDLKSKQYQPPSSLWHYTSFEILTHILDLKNECLKDRQMLNFHFGNPLQTNDKKEVRFFEEFVYDTKKGKELKLEVERVKTNIGNPFCLSLIHHIEDEKNYPSCEIPMWRMYGNQFSGVRLRFDFKKIKNHYSKLDNYNIFRCNYLTKTKMAEKGREIRKLFKQSDTCLDIEKIYKDAISYKTYDWVYENEWRIVAWCKDNNKVDFIPQTGRLYITQEIPLDFLETIEIGPKADQEAIEGSLNLIKEKIGDIKENHFNIKKSKLQIGYV